jgi:hypothetical protein
MGVAVEAAKAAFVPLTSTYAVPFRDAFSTEWTDILGPQFKQIILFRLSHFVRGLAV